MIRCLPAWLIFLLVLVPVSVVFAAQQGASGLVTRQHISLNGEWRIKQKGEEDWRQINLPSVIDEIGALFFRRNFKLPPESQSGKYVLVFEGINFASRIKLNGQYLSTQSHGFTRIEVPIPNDLINRNGENYLEVEVDTELDRQSIPLRHALLAPIPIRGIFRDVYLVAMPHISIVPGSPDAGLSRDFQTATLNEKTQILPDDVSIISGDSGYVLTWEIYEAGTQTAPVARQERAINLSGLDPIQSDVSLSWGKPRLWQPDDPQCYQLRIALTRQQTLVDEVKLDFGLRSLAFVADRIALNGETLDLRGISFLEDEDRRLTRSRARDTLNKVKALGFNLISWFSPPPDHALSLADSLGLLSLLRIPIWNIPGPVLADPDFQVRGASLLEKLTLLSGSHPSVLAISLGEGFDAISSGTQAFITAMTQSEKRDPSIWLTAGFRNYHQSLVNADLDFVSLNVNMHRPDNWRIWLNRWAAEGSGKSVLLTDISVPYFAAVPDSENVPGYEAEQAHRLKSIINEIQDESNLGYVISSLYDWHIEYPSMLSISGLDKTILPLGLSSFTESPRMAMNMMQNINQGTGYQFEFQPTAAEQFDTIFLLYGLSIIVVFLIFFRRDHRLRGNFIRLLSRPFGFHMELKDGRILPWFVTILVLIPTASSWGILLASVFSFLRHHPLFDFLISQVAPSDFFQKLFIYMAWNPFAGLVGFTLLTVLIFSIWAAYVFFLSIFSGQHLSFRNALTFVYWEGCIFVFLLPIAFVSYRLMAVSEIRILLFLLLLIFIIWYFYRILSGIQIIFAFKWGITAILFLGLPLVVLFVAVSLYNQSRGLNAQLSYLFHLWRYGL